MVWADEAAELSLVAATVNLSPGEPYADAARQWQGIPGIARTRNGRLWATWYSGGATEGPDNYVLVVTSDDDARSWSSPCLVIDPPGQVRAFDPVLWVDPRERLWLFWAQSYTQFDGRAGVWAIRCDDPIAAPDSWMAPRRVADGVMMNKPIVLSNGEWLLPTAVWSHLDCKRPDMAALRFSNVTASCDEGETFTLRGGADVSGRHFDEQMVVERVDGSLWMLVRTGEGVGEAVSHDQGRTWQANPLTVLPGPNSRVFLRQLQSGSLLLINHACLAWNGVTGALPPPEERPQAYVRTHLQALISDDDGRTWHGGLMLDERERVSYPDGVQGDDGRIYIIYDRDREGAKEILLALFTEEDVRQGHPVSGDTRLRVLVNNAGGQQ